uniref:Uncharacterized protein n=1 Tax=Avena sativa TaxID=4498 RepID=A0ACD5WA97_AVESA
MFLRSKVQEMILRRRSRSMNGGAQHASNPAPCDAGKGRGAPSFASPRLLHCSSLPAGSCATAGAGSPLRDSETAMAYSMSPTSVLDASAAFGGPAAADVSGKRRPWCDGCAGPHGLADALDCAHDGRERRRSILAGAVKAKAPALVRSCSLDRRVEFGVKNKSSWLPLRAGGRTAAHEEAAATRPAPDDEVEMEPSSEDYTCVISRGPNPRTVHIFGDRVIEGDHRAETSPRHITNHPTPARGDRGFLSL